MPDRYARVEDLQRVMRIWLFGRSDTVIGAYWPIKGEFDPPCRQGIKCACCGGDIGEQDLLGHFKGQTPARKSARIEQRTKAFGKIFGGQIVWRDVQRKPQVTRPLRCGAQGKLGNMPR